MVDGEIVCMLCVHGEWFESYVYMVNGMHVMCTW